MGYSVAVWYMYTTCKAQIKVTGIFITSIYIISLCREHLKSSVPSLKYSINGCEPQVSHCPTEHQKSSLLSFLPLGVTSLLGNKFYVWMITYDFKQALEFQTL